MKKTHLLLWLLMTVFCFAVSHAQTVKHHSYTTYFNQDLHEPDSVVWTLNAGMLTAPKTKRKDLFHGDPAISSSFVVADYINSHYDKGHMFPYQDAEGDATDRVECFYMSNMLPQLHVLNGGPWYDLECYCRDQAMKQPIKIVSGGTGSLGTIGKDKVNIPAACWKRVIFKDSVQYYVMPNSDTVKRHPFQYYRRK